MNSLVNCVLRTRPGFAELVLRLALGFIILPHGLQKTLGWFGGYGFQGTMGFFTGTMGIPALFAFLAIATESLGAVALIAGFGTRVASAATFILMTVAVLTTHLQNGFFMNWFGNQKGEGFEYHLLVMTIALALIIRGAGSYSVDRLISRSTDEVM